MGFFDQLKALKDKLPGDLQNQFKALKDKIPTDIQIQITINGESNGHGASSAKNSPFAEADDQNLFFATARSLRQSTRGTCE